MDCCLNGQVPKKKKAAQRRAAVIFLPNLFCPIRFSSCISQPAAKSFHAKYAPTRKAVSGRMDIQMFCSANAAGFRYSTSAVAGLLLAVVSAFILGVELRPVPLDHIV